MNGRAGARGDWRNTQCPLHFFNYYWWAAHSERWTGQEGVHLLPRRIFMVFIFGIDCHSSVWSSVKTRLRKWLNMLVILYPRPLLMFSAICCFPQAYMLQHFRKISLWKGAVFCVKCWAHSHKAFCNCVPSTSLRMDNPSSEQCVIVLVYWAPVWYLSSTPYLLFILIWTLCEWYYYY